MDSVMSKKREVVPSELLSKEFLSQFKTEADVSKFLKELHSQVLEQMLQFDREVAVVHNVTFMSDSHSSCWHHSKYLI